MQNFKTERLSHQIKTMPNDDYNDLRQAVFQISDGYYALKELKGKTSNPDFHRLLSQMKEVMDGPMAYFSQVL